MDYREPDESVDSPVGLNHPGIRRFSPAARRALRRLGLLRGAWIERLARAPKGLVRFVNRFYVIAGFEHLMQDSFGAPYQRRVARLARRLIRRLVERNRNALGTLSIVPSIGVTPGGAPAQVLMVTGLSLHYLLLPWPRLTAHGLVRQLRQSTALYGDPTRVRWVFDGQPLGMTQSEAADEAQRLLSRAGIGSGAARWLAALDRVVRVL